VCSSKGIHIQLKKITVLAKQNPAGHNVACRVPDCNNVRCGGKHSIKEEIKISWLNGLEVLEENLKESKKKILSLFFFSDKEKPDQLGKGDSIISGNFL